jgi:hypothetical protein
MRLSNCLILIVTAACFAFFVYCAYIRDVNVVERNELPTVFANNCVRDLSVQKSGGILVPNQEKIIYRGFQSNNKSTLRTGKKREYYVGKEHGINGEQTAFDLKKESGVVEKKPRISSLYNEIFTSLKERREVVKKHFDNVNTARQQSKNNAVITAQTKVNKKRSVFDVLD